MTVETRTDGTRTDGTHAEATQTEAALTRRAFIHRVGVWSAIAASSGLVLQACGGESGTAGGDGKKAASSLKCDDTASLTDTEKAQRTALGYVEASVQPDKNCTNCLQFTVPETAGTCGKCKVVPGTIHPEGYCNVYVVKPA